MAGGKVDHVGDGLNGTGDAYRTQQSPVYIDHDRIAAHSLATLTALPGTLAELVKLNIFETLARVEEGKKLTSRELAALTLPGKSINVSYLERMLRFISSRGRVFNETVTIGVDGRPERRYELTPVGKFFVNNNETGSFAKLLLMNTDPVFSQTWSHIHESIIDDTLQPFARAHGGLDAWEYGRQDFRFDKIFNEAMTDHSKIYLRAILDAYHGFDDVKVLVDVGGGFGSTLSLITARYSHIKGINFDQPHVIAVCPQLPGVEFVSGDMFESVPSGDAIFMKLVTAMDDLDDGLTHVIDHHKLKTALLSSYILHDWDDVSNLKLLKNCYKALPAHGKVIAVDFMLPEKIDPERDTDEQVFTGDVSMLAYNVSGARERTENEMRELGLSAGFSQVIVSCKVDGFSVVEMLKA